MVHRRREGQDSPVFLPQEPHEQYKKENNMPVKDESIRLEAVRYATGEEQRAITTSSKSNEMAKQKHRSAVDVSGAESKTWCCKEEHGIGTWNVRSMNQGKLDVVKQEMARVNIDILGISELKWVGMGEFNSDDHAIYYCRQESLRRNGVALRVNKSPECTICMQTQKWQNDLILFPRQSIQHHSNPSLCHNHRCQRSEGDQFYEDLQHLLELTHTHTHTFSILGDWNAKQGSQDILGITGKFGLGLPWWLRR